MAKVLCMLYDDPRDGYPTSYARDVEYLVVDSSKDGDDSVLDPASRPST